MKVTMKLLVCTIALAMVSTRALAADSHPAMQINWTLSEDDWSATAKNLDKNPELKVRMFPSRLYVATQEVVGSDGSRLLPAGAQLFPMMGAGGVLCSQTLMPVPYAGNQGRICLVDQDKDGSFDHSFTAGFDKSWLAKRPGWWIVNMAAGADLSPIQVPHLSEIDRHAAERTLTLELHLRPVRGGKILSSIQVEGLDSRLSGQCAPQKVVGPDLVSFCFARDFIVTFRNFESSNSEDRQLEIKFPAHITSIYMNISKGWIGSEVDYVKFD